MEQQPRILEEEKIYVGTNKTDEQFYDLFTQRKMLFLSAINLKKKKTNFTSSVRLCCLSERNQNLSLYAYILSKSKSHYISP